MLAKKIGKRYYKRIDFVVVTRGTAVTTIKLPKNRMDYLIEQLEHRAEPAVLRRGWEYVHRGLVNQVRLVQGCILEAKVRGNKHLFLPRLDLIRFDRSECNCSRQGLCPHLAAVVFQVYSAYGRPELLLMQLRNTVLVRSKQARPSQHRTSRMDAIPLEIRAEDTPRLWHKAFEQRFYGYTLSNQHSVEHFHETVLQTLDKEGTEWPPVLRLIYSLHLSLFICKKIHDFYHENKSSYLSVYIMNGCKAVAESCRERLEHTTEQLREIVRDAADRYPEHWEESAGLVGETLLLHGEGPVHWLDLYRYLWGSLFWNTPGFAENESKRLEQLAQSTGSKWQEDGALLALAYFLVLDGRSKEALERLERLNAKRLADFYLILDHFVLEGDWETLLDWLRWLLPVMEKAKQDEFNKACSYWVEAMKHQPDDEEWIRVMLSLLPRSYPYYTDYLFATRRYRQWIDLQLSAGVSPEQLYPTELRVIEAHDPALLLPLYHQGIERAIQLKTRDAYKSAIKLLNKLHDLYHKMGQPQVWNTYLAKLAAKYARLRAFQEELDKGKWTS